MERIYNKLVRDKIPNIIKEKGETPVVRILDEIEYKNELEKKLYEEYKEVIEATGDDRVEEMADMLEVIRALANLENKNLNEVIAIADKKMKNVVLLKKRFFLKKLLKENKKIILIIVSVIRISKLIKFMVKTKINETFRNYLMNKRSTIKSIYYEVVNYI